MPSLSPDPAPGRAGCPPWCQDGHVTEPADHHAGVLAVSGRVALAAALTPAGLAADVLGPAGDADGSVRLTAADVVALAAALARLTA